MLCDGPRPFNVLALHIGDQPEEVLTLDMSRFQQDLDSPLAIRPLDTDDKVMIPERDEADVHGWKRMQ